MLRHCGFDVTVMAEVDTALDHIRQVTAASQQPPLIVADLSAAGDDALELAEQFES